VKSAPKAPLSGVRILDLTSVIMGPFATHILADLGADVIKIESPEGDSLRNYTPQRHQSMSGSFLNLNRNKRSVCLDLKSDGGRRALDRLIATADVFVHNFRPGPMGRLGYDFDRVRTLRPEIVYCGAYGFGAAGPYAEKAAYDDIIQAGSGLAALYQAAHGAPGYAPTVICDKLAGQAVAYAILAALFHRERGGGGQAIEVPMFETSIEFNLMEHMNGFAFEPPLGPPQFARVLSPSRKPYATRDGFICILPYSDKNWRDFYAFCGRTEFEDDPRFRTLAIRVLHIDALYRMVEQEAAKRTTDEWLTFCDQVGIPAMPVRSLEELVDDPHVQAVGLFQSAVHPTEGPYRVVRRPISFSSSPFDIDRHAPTHGQHTVEVLREAGLTASEIESVRVGGLEPGASPSAANGPRPDR
jgi:crotonobetainyl-CoA:carnitine CoA-transferase CaiB-like acyl-CoA transferase